MKRFLERLNIDFGKFNLTDEDFKIDSDIHGIGHVYRVMFNTLLLGNQLDDVKNTKNSFYAAFIHDLSRRHDGHCELHGGFSVDENFDKYKHLFVDGNFDDIKMACIRHSLSNELPKEHKSYKSTAILKDADALDRVRLSELDIKFLRFKESHDLIKISEDLFFNYKNYDSFEDFLYNNLD